MNKIKRPLLLLFALLSLALIIAACSNTYIGRYVRWNFPDVYDLNKFPFLRVERGGNVNVFPSMIRTNIDSIQVFNEGVQVNLKDLLTSSKTRAFIILRNDTLITEWYRKGDTRETLFKSYSMTKSVLSILIGIAISEGHIKDVDEPIQNYIKRLSTSVGQLTIKQCLLQTTRIRYDERYLPWSDEPRWYYTKDARALTTKVKIDETRKSVYENVEYNVLLLGMVLEKATGRTITQYLEDKLWKISGMEFPATFSIDSEETHFEKVGDGFNARPMDMVRLGKLLLDSGIYKNRTIVPQEWILESTSFEGSIPTQWNNVNYKYLWWVKSNGDYYANGHFGQYIYISPRTQTVIVRLGEESNGICWWCVWPQVADALKIK
jgi:CubicO group peptidase (beta-lactamase class C family)